MKNIFNFIKYKNINKNNDQLLCPLLENDESQIKKKLFIKLSPNVSPLPSPRLSSKLSPNKVKNNTVFFKMNDKVYKRRPREEKYISDSPKFIDAFKILQKTENLLHDINKS